MVKTFSTMDFHKPMSEMEFNSRVSDNGYPVKKLKKGVEVQVGSQFYEFDTEKFPNKYLMVSVGTLSKVK